MADSNFLWHKVSEQEKKEITENAKRLMDDFAKKLEKIKTSESHFENGDGLRTEGEAWNTDPEFRNVFFCNAPESEDNFIIAEKGAWK